MAQETIQEQVARMEQEMDAQVVTPEGWTRGELKALFNAVANPQDWKAPITATIQESLLPKVSAAIQFFTATTPAIIGTKPGFYIIQAVGYRMGPAGP